MARKNRRMSVLKRQREQKKVERKENKTQRRQERRDGIANGTIPANGTSSEQESFDSDIDRNSDESHDHGSG